MSNHRSNIEVIIQLKCPVVLAISSTVYLGSGLRIIHTQGHVQVILYHEMSTSSAFCSFYSLTNLSKSFFIKNMHHTLKGFHIKTIYMNSH